MRSGSQEPDDPAAGHTSHKRAPSLFFPHPTCHHCAKHACPFQEDGAVRADWQRPPRPCVTPPVAVDHHGEVPVVEGGVLLRASAQNAREGRVHVLHLHASRTTRASRRYAREVRWGEGVRGEAWRSAVISG